MIGQHDVLDGPARRWFPYGGRLLGETKTAAAPAGLRSMSSVFRLGGLNFHISMIPHRRIAYADAYLKAVQKTGTKLRPIYQLARVNLSVRASSCMISA